jgi:hypothetical protein
MEKAMPRCADSSLSGPAKLVSGSVGFPKNVDLVWVVDSTNLKYVGVEKEEFCLRYVPVDLWIMFHRGDVYRYFKVPPSIVTGLLNASSVGKYFHSYILRKWKYEKVT